MTEDKNMLLVYSGNSFGTKFNVKDKTKKEHQNNLLFLSFIMMKLVGGSENELMKIV